MNIFESLHPAFEDLVDLNSTLELLKAGLQFTEGPVWHAQENCLYFSDIPADTLYRYSSAKGVEVVYHPSGFSNGLTLDHAGNLIVCEHHTRAITTYKNGQKQILADHYQGKKLNSPNDLVLSKNGVLYFTDPIYGLRAGNGGPAIQELSFQGLFSYRQGWSEPHLERSDLERPNGVALSYDQSTLYAIDTVKQHVRQFTITEKGNVSGGQVIMELWGAGDARPDGLKLDRDGNFFVTGPEGIWVFREDHTLLGKIHFAQKTANLAWGDEDRKTLYITSSQYLFRLRMKTSGWSPLDSYS